MNFGGHTATNCLVAGASGAALYTAANAGFVLSALFVVGFLVGTFFIGPDLDLRHSKPTKNWKVLGFIWYPYAFFFKHRGMSHYPLVSTIIRCGYLAAVFYLFYLSAVYWLDVELGIAGNRLFELEGSNEPVLSKVWDDGEKLRSFLNMYSSEALFFAAGVAGADMTHVTVDSLSTRLKKIF